MISYTTVFRLFKKHDNRKILLQKITKLCQTMKCGEHILPVFLYIYSTLTVTKYSH